MWEDIEGGQIAAAQEHLNPPRNVKMETNTRNNESVPYLRQFFWSLIFFAFVFIYKVFDHFKTEIWKPTYKPVPISPSRTSSYRQSYNKAISRGFKHRTVTAQPRLMSVPSYQPLVHGRASVTSDATLESQSQADLPSPVSSGSHHSSVPFMSLRSNENEMGITEDYEEYEMDDAFEKRKYYSMPARQKKRSRPGHPSTSSVEIVQNPLPDILNHRNLSPTINVKAQTVYVSIHTVQNLSM